MKKLYYYPSARKGVYLNPYSAHYKEAMNKYFRVLDTKARDVPGLSTLLLPYSFVADVFIFSWIENIRGAHAGILQFWNVCLCLFIIRLRRKKIVWMFHNFHGHGGQNRYADYLMSYLFKHACLIICHSKAAAEYAKERAACPVRYECHPVAPLNNLAPYAGTAETNDVLIWGAISPYKGIPEFLSYEGTRTSGLKILIIGKCSNAELEKRIRSLCTGNIRFDNRKPDFSELKAGIAKSRYVLFPYVGGSISSSGALIDTIALGGTPVGPNVGAFKDLAEDGLCYVYDTYGGLMNILAGDKRIDDRTRRKFISGNTWEAFAARVARELETCRAR